VKILFAASEVAPYAKTGGLAAVAGSLPAAMTRLGHEVTVVLPCHQEISQRGFNPSDTGIALKVRMAQRSYTARVREFSRGNLRILFIEQHELFDRPGLYGYSSGDWPDNARRFAFFCRASLQMLKPLGFRPDILHLNDWQTALTPLLLKEEWADDPFFARTRSLFTIHNLGYQGCFPDHRLKQLDLPECLFRLCRLDGTRDVSLLKAGLLFADRLNTVSPGYAREILSTDFGCGLDTVLRQRRSVLSGILNGLDNSSWDPRRDPELPEPYDAENPAGKTVCKTSLQHELGLVQDSTRLLAALVTRLDKQKGLDLLLDIWKKLQQRPVQLVLLGTGDKDLQQRLQAFGRQARGQTAMCFCFDERLARRIYAGADLFLMPSRYEPCGLGQLIALRYGAVPLVRYTGGLADTVTDLEEAPQRGTGFSFREARGDDLLAAIDRALDYFSRHEWQSLMQRGMRQDFSWDRSALEYNNLYQQTLET